MKKHEIYLTCLSEECAEVAHRVSKALRFGLNEIEPEQNYSNAERIAKEINDLFVVVDLLESANLIPNLRTSESKAAKITKLADSFRYSKELKCFEDA